MNKAISVIWLAGVIALSLAGLLAFYLLFVRDMNIYWLILSPIIIAIYQIPAVFLLHLWKKKKRNRPSHPDGEVPPAGCGSA